VRIELKALAARHPAARAGAAPALQPLSLAVASGELLAVIGPSGAGKTTLLQALACAVRPDAGRLLIDGQDPWSLSSGALRRLRGQLFLAPQVPPLPPRQRVVTAVLAGRLPQMSLWTSLRSLVYPVGIAAADAALSRFDLSDKLFARVDRLSGGERQRVGLARAVIADARMLLVDEPLSALDPARAQQAIASLTHAGRESGATLVCTMHDVPMALAHFPRVIGLQGGQLAFDLPAAEVTPERLSALYAQHLDELQGGLPSGTSEAAAPRPVVVHCR
jgi:phosphonate transport system ATP-binding protein